MMNRPALDAAWQACGLKPNAFDDIAADIAIDATMAVDPGLLAGDDRLAGVRVLRLVHWPATGSDWAAPDWTPLLAAFLGRAWPRLTELRIEGHGGYDGEVAKTVGDLSRLWTQAPALASLVVYGDGLTLGTIAAPALARLELHVRELTPAHAVSLRTAQVPALRTLGLSALEGTWPGDALPVAPLAELTLAGDDWRGPAVFDAIASVLPRLRRLALPQAHLTRDDAKWIEANAGRFHHLEELVLDDDRWPSSVCRALVAALPRASFGQGPVGVADDEPRDEGIVSEIGDDVPLDDWELALPTMEALAAAGIRTVQELVRKSPHELMESGHFRRKSIRELREILADMGLHLRH